MYVAKMTTRYPDFKGVGYYNFLVEEDDVYLAHRIEENLHDFTHQGTMKGDVEDVNELMEKYPTKEDLNKVFENVKV